MCRVSCYNNLLHAQNYGLSAASYGASFVSHLSKATYIACKSTQPLVESIGKWGFPVAGVVLAINNVQICGITDKCIKIVSPGFTNGLNTEVGMNCLIMAIGAFAALKFAESLSEVLFKTSNNVVSGCENWRYQNLDTIATREKAALKEEQKLKILEEKQKLEDLEKQKLIASKEKEYVEMT